MKSIFYTTIEEPISDSYFILTVDGWVNVPVDPNPKFPIVLC